ncbi:MAG TPA: hypothetical protein VGM34_01865 [Chlamydiales bacterium]|jgi:peptidoglycan hydrolase CwlO-like protein
MALLIESSAGQAISEELRAQRESSLEQLQKKIRSLDQKIENMTKAIETANKARKEADGSIQFWAERLGFTSQGVTTAFSNMLSLFTGTAQTTPPKESD